VAPSQSTCHHENCRHCSEGRDVSVWDSAEFTADEVGDRVERRRYTDPDERNRQAVGATGPSREQEDDSESDLEGADILQEVLVVRLEPGDCLEKRLGRGHRPHSERHERSAADNRDDAWQRVADCRSIPIHVDRHSIVLLQNLPAPG
jgi:hypothetical protein